MTDTNEMRKLLAAATPLPWAVSYGDDMWTVEQTKAEFHGRLLARRTAFDDGSAGGEYVPSCNGATRDLIVAAVNGLPAMLDELDAARAEVERLQGIIDDVESESGHCHFLDDAEHEPPHLADHVLAIVQERDAANAQLREAMELLRAHGHPPTWLSLGDAANWNTRYGKLLKKHKKTNQ